jgi:hypothetical protein
MTPPINRLKRNLKWFFVAPVVLAVSFALLQLTNLEVPAIGTGCVKIHERIDNVLRISLYAS